MQLAVKELQLVFSVRLITKNLNIDPAWVLRIIMWWC